MIYSVDDKGIRTLLPARPDLFIADREALEERYESALQRVYDTGVKYDHRALELDVFRDQEATIARLRNELEIAAKASTEQQARIGALEETLAMFRTTSPAN
jgi:hypothetical protein